MKMLKMLAIAAVGSILGSHDALSTSFSIVDIPSGLYEREEARGSVYSLEPKIFVGFRDSTMPLTGVRQAFCFPFLCAKGFGSIAVPEFLKELRTQGFQEALGTAADGYAQEAIEWKGLQYPHGEASRERMGKIAEKLRSIDSLILGQGQVYLTEGDAWSSNSINHLTQDQLLSGSVWILLPGI